MDVKQKLIDVLESFNLPVFLQGSLQDDVEYPDSFFTFWNNDTFDDDYYNNVETATVWSFDVNYYSNEPESVNAMLLQAKAALKKQGFIVGGKGYDVASDEPTHTGRGIEIEYIERYGV